MVLHMNEYLTQLDFPKVPKHIEDECILACGKEPIFTLRIEECIPHGQCLFSAYAPPDSLIRWLHSNELKVHKVAIQKIYDGTKLLPHTDKGVGEYASRSYAINYLLTEASPVTSWYDEKYRKLFSYTIPDRKWYKLKTDVLHGVENITSTRIAISLS